MPKLIDLARVLFSPLLLILSACDIGGTTYSNRIANDGHDVLSSRARVRDGVARFECKASDSGRCHYTLYPQRCAGTGCNAPPLRSFDVASGEAKQIAGLSGFRLCVDGTDTAPGPDCKPRAKAATH